MAEEVEFTEEQQEFVNELVGKTRVEAREKALEKAEQDKKDAIASVRKEMSSSKGELSTKLEEYEAKLEPLQEQVESYRELIDGMLESKIETLGDEAAKSLEDIPGSSLDKLNWLRKNEHLFGDAGPVGTPRSRRGGSTNSKGNELDWHGRL